MAKSKTIQVRAKVAHTQPGTLIYREEGTSFPHTGDLYEHVEPAGAQVESEEDEIRDLQTE